MDVSDCGFLVVVITRTFSRTALLSAWLAIRNRYPTSSKQNLTPRGRVITQNSSSVATADILGVIILLGEVAMSSVLGRSRYVHLS